MEAFCDKCGQQRRNKPRWADPIPWMILCQFSDTIRVLWLIALAGMLMPEPDWAGALPTTLRWGAEEWVFMAVGLAMMTAPFVEGIRAFGAVSEWWAQRKERKQRE